MAKVDIEFNSGAQLPMDAIPGLAQLAERHGFECAWGGEANNKDLTVMLGAIAAVTNQLYVGSAVYHMVGRTPATLALQAAGLNELSKGRFLLGIGISNRTIANWHGAPFEHPMERIREYLDIVRQAMRGEKLNFRGKHYWAKGFKLAFRPTGREVPIYLAAFGPKMSYLAGELTDGVLINMASPSEVRRVTDTARSGALHSGKSAEKLEVICKVRCSVSESREAARGALRKILTYYALAEYYRNLFHRMGFGDEVETLRAAWAESGFEAARARISDRFLQGVPMIAATSAAEVREKLQPFLNAGATRIILPYVPSSENVVEEMKCFISAWDRG